MEHDLTERGIELMRKQRFGHALPLFRRAMELEPMAWNNWYMAGQCCRFLNDLESSVEYLTRATELEEGEAPVFLALGIAHQLSKHWAAAAGALGRAIAIDPDYDLAYNSLAYTQQKAGALEKALHNYFEGAQALSRRIVSQLRNTRANRILKHRDTTGTLWMQHALYGALYVTVRDESARHLTWPTGAQAEREERSEEHGGLYWVDYDDANNGAARYFLPNYFNTFRESLRSDPAYSTLVGNRGVVLEMMGRDEEARLHFDEATEFLPAKG
jgi:tetratricopeptide (TPR) repeat protein